MSLNTAEKPSKRNNEKEVREFLMRQASLLPVTYETFIEGREFTGLDVMYNPELLKALTPDQLENLQEDKKYVFSVEVARPVNHYKRMLKAAKSKGPEAAVAYFNQVLSEQAENYKPHQIGGLTTQIEYGNPFQNY